MTKNRVAGLFLIVLGLHFAREIHKGFIEGNMTMSAIAPAYLDKNPILFWINTCMMVAAATMCVLFGIYALITG